MDKALEVIMVAMILVVAAVVILAMLQGRTGDFTDFTQDRVNSSSCGMLELKYQRNIQCPSTETPSATAAETEASNQGCEWPPASPSDYC
ncbi:MAG: hypothetical protein ABEJ36_04235 [Candidatus Nanosalina sp.]